MAQPRIEIREYDIPVPSDDEVLIEVKACGICGSDVHMAQAEADGYIFYPGLTGFPSILGHELSGVVVEAGKNAYDKNTNKPYKGGEEVTTEEMLWCGSCKPCADGWPNHCERLDEIGFNVHGAFTKYLVVPARTLWSLEPLKERYPEDKLFLAGSLVEHLGLQCCYQARGHSPWRPRSGPGGGPVGLAACAILKRWGFSDHFRNPGRSRQDGSQTRRGYHINPLNGDFAETVLELTNGMGADLFMKPPGYGWSTGYRKVIWEGRTLNSKVVVTAR